MTDPNYAKGTAKQQQNGRSGQQPSKELLACRVAGAKMYFCPQKSSLPVLVAGAVAAELATARNTINHHRYGEEKGNGPGGII